MAADTTLAKLRVIIDATVAPFKKGLKDVERATQATTQTVNAHCARIRNAVAGAVSIAAITAFGKSCIELGSDLTEVQNVVDVTFGSLAENVNTFSKNALTAYGLSETKAKQYTSTMGAMLKSMGLNTQQAYDMGTSITALAADMASFYNLDNDTAFEKIRSGMSGETEPLKQLGINMSVANMEAYALSQGITKAYQSMTQQEQALLRYNYLLSVTGDAQGDFSRTSDQWANQVRILTERFNALRAQIGQGLIMALTPVLQMLNRLLERLLTVSDAFTNFIARVTGNNVEVSSTAGSAVDSTLAIGDAADESAKETEKAAKKMQAAIMGFDEINRRSDANKDDEEDDGGIGNLSAAPITSNLQEAANAGNQELSPALQKLLDILGRIRDVMGTVRGVAGTVKDKLAELAGIWADGFKSGLGVESLEDLKARLAPIKENILSIGRSLKDIFTDPEVTAAADRWAQKTAFALGQIAGAGASIGISLATNVTGGIAKWLEEDSPRIKNHMITMFDIHGEVSEMMGNTAESVGYILSAIGGENGQQVTTNIIGIFANAFMGVSEVAAKFGRDIINVITKPINDNKEELHTALDNALGVISNVTGTIRTNVAEDFEKLNEVYDEHIKPFFDDVADGLSRLTNLFLKEFFNGNDEGDIPVFEDLGNKMSSLLEDHVQPMVQTLTDLLGALFDVLDDLWKNVVEPFLTWLIPVLADGVDGVFTTVLNLIGDLCDAIQKVAKFLVDHPALLEAIVVALGSLAVSLKTVKTATSVMKAFKEGGKIYKKYESAVKSATKVMTAFKEGDKVTEKFGKALGALPGKLGAITSPAGIAVIAITGIITAGVLLYKNWDKVKEVAETVWGGIQEFISCVVEGLTDLFDGLKTGVSVIWDGVQAVWETIWNTITGIVSGIVDGVLALFTSLKNTVTGLWDTITETWENIWNGVKDAVSGIVDGIKGFFTGLKDKAGEIWDGVKDKASEVWNGVKDTVSGAVDTVKTKAGEVKDKVSDMWGDAKDKASDVMGHVKDKATEAWNKVKDVPVVGELMTNFENNMKAEMSFVKDIITGDWDSAWNTVKSVTNEVVGPVKDKVVELKDHVKEKWEDIKSATSEKWEDVKSKVTTKAMDLAHTAYDEFTNFALDTKEKWNDIKTATSEKWEDIRSKVTDKASALKDKAVEHFGKLKDKAGEKWDAMKSDASEKWDSLKSTISDVANDILSAITKPFDNIKDKGKEIIQKFIDGFKSLNIPMPHFDVEWPDDQNGFVIPHVSFEWRAGGGLVDTGQMFVAREAGPELVGTMGGKTAVANNDQIVAGISVGVHEAVYDALRRAAADAPQTDGGDMVLVIDGEELARAVDRGRSRRNRRFDPTIAFT